MQKAQAFIFAAEEDFGITPVEAQACGTPVIAYGKGGALETIIGIDNEKPTGIFFRKQTIDSICNTVNNFEKNKYKIKPENCRVNAERFSNKRFIEEIKNNLQINFLKLV